eukprot:4440246-Karenia_brevis.AAC.1
MPEGGSLDLVGTVWKDGYSADAMARLPEGVRPRNALQPGDIMQILVEKNPDGTHTMLKHFLLKESITKTDALGIAVGTVMLVPWRPSVHDVKTAFQLALQKTTGRRLLFASLTSKSSQDP